MERWNSLPPLLRQILVAIVFFVIGAAGAFGYSYRPLHGALSFKVDVLEARIDERNRENTALKDQIASLQKEREASVEPEALAQVESELTKTRKALRVAEEKAKRAEGKERDASANASRWRKRFETLRDERAAIAAAPPERLPAPEPEPDFATPLPGAIDAFPPRDAQFLP